MTEEEYQMIKSAYEDQWLPILSYLQDNPDVIGLKVGDSISDKLLEYLKGLKQ